MRINHNIAALNTYRQLNTASTAQSKSMEKLSSGLRINKAGDDAAGLAISEKMRGQIRGLDMASKNAQDGISMIQTAEGALNETHDILQRMRELATQASNDTNTDSDRGEIQKEMNQLTSEINRIGNTTEFNTKKILRGDGSNAKAVGELKLGETGAIAQTALSTGSVTPATGANLQISLTSGEGADELDGQEFTFEFNGESVKVNFSNVADASDPKANTFEVKDGGREVTISLVDGNTNQKFITSKLQEGLEAALQQNSNIDANNYTFSRNDAVLTVNSVAIGEGQSISVVGASGQTALTASSDKGANFAAVEDTAVEVTGSAESRTRATATLADFTAADIKSQILESGISVSNTDYFDSGTVSADGATKFLAGKGFTIGNETIEFFNGNEGKYEGSADFSVDLSLVTWANGGTTALDSSDEEALVASIVDQVGSKMKDVTLTVNSGAAGSIDVTAKEPGLAGNSIEVKDGVSRPASDVIGSTFKAAFQIGANKGQSMTVEFGDMRSEALNIVGKAGQDHTTVDGAKFTAANNVTNGTDNNEYVAALDVSTHESATAAIEVINNAIEKVSAERSKLGASQNRLEHTINNLNTSSENLTAAESRVRDVDMAKEMMTQTKNSILSQAAQAMLAQANQQPQGVLQLLR
ncbi:flagellin protein [Bacillus infantis]|uniref:flagellin N-terminal helical domain-containing protein n=1 Tax=Bacillus infantis TaxID=324767 RepID=UPI001CD262BB|nr:flagellin [Bacillus infantis]MCA1040472.1 flagellin protein [Bacillus infantis]